MDDKVIDMILSDLKELKRDVKSLIALKYQIFGIVIGVSLIGTFITNFFIHA